MGIQNGFDFRGVDVEAESDDEILRTPDDEEIAVLEAGEITGVKPSFGIDRGRGFFRRAIIAFHDVGPTHPQFADSSLLHRLPVISNQSGFDPRKHWADGVIFPRRDVQPYLRYVRRTLRDAVAVMQGQAKQTFYGILNGRRQRSSRTRNDPE